MYYSIAVIFYCCMGATKIFRSTDERRTTMVKKINSSEFEQVKNNKAIIVDFRQSGAVHARCLRR